MQTYFRIHTEYEDSITNSLKWNISHVHHMCILSKKGY